MIYIYALIPSKGSVKEIGYIGIAEDLTQRLSQHRCSNEDTAKGQWIKSLRANSQTVDMIVIDRAETRIEAHILENAWILFARRSGWPITNGTSPGQHRDLFAPGFDAAAEIKRITMSHKGEVDRYRSDIQKAQYDANIAILNTKLEAERQARIEAKRRFDFVVNALAKLYVVGMIFLAWSFYTKVSGLYLQSLFAILGILMVGTADMVFKFFMGNIPIYRLDVPEVLTVKSAWLMFYNWWRSLNGTEKLVIAQMIKFVFVYPWLLPMSTQ